MCNARRRKCAREMTNPTRGSWTGLKKSCGVFDWSPTGDVDDAGKGELRCPKRKSASGGMMMMHRTVVKHVSENTGDACVELGRSRNCAVITGAAEALGMQSMLMDLGGG